LSKSADKLRLGLIGCGTIAQDSHLPAIKQIASAQLVAVADTDKIKVKSVQENFHSVDIYENYQELLENEEVDAVDICAPTKYHSTIAVAAANSGKHVLCEKPIALTLGEADRMIKACAENHVKLMIAHSRRFIPRYSIVRRIIKQGQIGKPVWGLQISRRHMTEPGSWYFDPAMTYGPLAEVGIHDADLLRWLFDDDVVEVQGTARARTTDSLLYDQVFAALKFKRGPVGSFEVGYVLPKGYAQYTTLEVLGSKGFVSAADNHMNVILKGTESGVTYPLAYSDLLTVNTAYVYEIAAFIDSVIHDRVPPVTGQDARAALEIILAVLQSIRQRGPTKLPLEER
jgi:predicted dehydrogenase